MPDNLQDDPFAPIIAEISALLAEYIRMVNRERDAAYRKIASMNFAGGCMGRAAKRLQILEDVATRKNCKYVEIYELVSHSSAEEEMFSTSRMEQLRKNIKRSINQECTSVKEMTERDCHAADCKSTGAGNICQQVAQPRVF